MGTTVQYDGATIGTFSKSTKSLATSARWMKDDIIITDTGMDADDSLYQDKNGFITVSDDYGTATHTESLTITENGAYNAPANTAYSSVKIAVPCDSFIESVIDRSVTEVTAENLNGITQIQPYTFYGCKNLTSVDATNIILIDQYAFAECVNLSNINMSNVTTVQTKAFTNTAIKQIGYNDLPKLSKASGSFIYGSNIELVIIVNELAGDGNVFQGATKLKTIDFLKRSTLLSGYFIDCNILTTIILRKDQVVSLGNTNVFTNTPFASGNSGGTLYVPQALIETYQSATNWSTILGYENNQILPIEGSQYEHYYADGTPISPNDNLIFIPYCKDGNTMPDGQVVTTGTFLVTPFMRVDGGENYYSNITTYYNASDREWNQKIYYYDINRDYIKLSQITNSSSMGTMNQYTMPDNARYVRICFRVEYSDIAYFGKSGVMINND